MGMREPITSLEDPVDQKQRAPHETRLFIFRIVIFVAFALLAGQLWRLQIVEGKQHREYADNNRFREVPLPPTRGVIYDRSGILLVRNMPSYAVSIVPADLPQEPAVVFRRVGRLLHLDPNVIAERVEAPPAGKNVASAFTPVTLAQNVDEQTAFLIMERHLDLPGVHVDVQPIREYLDGPLTSHVLGFLGQISAEQFAKLKDDPKHGYEINDQIGQAGVELTFESDLRGQPGRKQMEVNAAGREVNVLRVDPPGMGHNLRLTLDLALQQKATEILQTSLDRYGSASAVALDPRNGQVLALVHLPSYDNNLFAKGISQNDYNHLIEDPRRPLVDGALSSAYSPGSTFMVVTAVAGLAEKVVEPQTRLDCNGKLVVPNLFDSALSAEYPDTAAHGAQDVVSALADSCRVYFYQVGGGAPKGEWKGLGPSRLADYARLLGFGQPSGIDLPGEVAGVVPSPEWKEETYKEEWVAADTYNMAIGLGAILTTPLQMANAMAAIANGGTLYRPQIVLEVLDSEGQVVRPYVPQVIRSLPVDAATLEPVRAGLVASLGWGRTPYGTYYTGAIPLRLQGIDVAGKAGTGEHMGSDGKLTSHGWFVAFAPADKPRIALAVFVERGTGPEEAARAAMEILSAYLGAPIQEGQPSTGMQTGSATRSGLR